MSYECRSCFGVDTDDCLSYVDNSNSVVGGIENYGQPPAEYNRKALWPITFEEFSLVTSQLAIMLRGNLGTTTQQQ